MKPPKLKNEAAPPEPGAFLRLSRHDWLSAFVFAAAALLALSFLRAAESPVAREYQIKAGYLFNFAKYVEWPATSMPAADSPLVIGVMDGSEALPDIQRQLQGKTVNDRPLQVKSVATASASAGCHILFVCRSAGKTPAEVREAVGAAAILIVGETDQFAERGGMIGFVREEGSFRLNLNLEAATQAGLKVSARLSTVAKVVKGKPEK